MMERFLKTPLRFRVAVVYSGLIFLALAVLNLLTSPSYLWCFYLAFGLAWWPLSAYFYGRREPLRYALWGAGLIAALCFLTWLFSGHSAHPWYAYPILAVLWWPLSVWGAKAGAKRFSVVAAEYIIVMVLTVNMITSPGYWWWLFPAALVIWWPLVLHFPHTRHKEGDPS